MHRVLLLLAALALAFPARAELAKPDRVVDLWPGVAPDMTDPPATEDVADNGESYSKISHPTLSVFYARQPNGAALLVIPGGGFTQVVFAKEGVEIAQHFATLGIDAYVLKYRLPEETFNAPSVAFQDGQRAMRLIRSGTISAGRGTDPNRIGVIGFSAGGTVAGVLGTYFDASLYAPVDAADQVSARPDFMILGYPSIFAKREFPAARPVAGTPSWVRFWSIASPFPFDAGITARTPPAFVFVGGADKRLPTQRAINVAAFLNKANVPVELYVYPDAPHGFALRGTGPEKAWPMQCERWLKARGIIP